MTQSALATRVIPHHNKLGSRQGNPITRVIQHHWAGPGGDARLANPSQQASANYLIFSDGTIAVQVPEEYRAWTSGSFEADGNAITIECENSSYQVNGNDNDPNSWKVSDAALASIIRLVADIARRYKFGAVTEGNYLGHRVFQSTACPGGYLWHKMGEIRNRINQELNGKPFTPAAPPTAGKTIWQLADEVLAGVHGNGAARQASLGANYAAVQAEVDRRLGAGPGQSAAAPQAPNKSIAQLADEVMAGVHGSGVDRQVSLAGNYAAVQAEVNRRLGAGGSTGGPNISQLADAVMRGEYGNGEERQRRLGANFTAVQNEINRRFNVAPAPAPQKSIAQLADEVMAGKHGNGADRQRSLGANFAAVQAEINRRYS